MQHKNNRLISLLPILVLLLITSCKKSNQQERIKLEKEIQELNEKFDKEWKKFEDNNPEEKDSKGLDKLSITKTLLKGLALTDLQKLLETYKTANQGLAEKVKQAEANGEISFEVIPGESSRSVIDAKKALKLEELIPLQIEVRKKEAELDKLKQ